MLHLHLRRRRDLRGMTAVAQDFVRRLMGRYRHHRRDNPGFAFVRAR